MIKAEWTIADTLNLQPTCNQLATDCISRQAAIDEVKHYIEIGYDSDIIHTLGNLPSAKPEIIRCKDCKHKNVYRFPPKYDERDYCEKLEKVVCVADFCCWAERRTDE